MTTINSLSFCLREMLSVTVEISCQIKKRKLYQMMTNCIELVSQDVGGVSARTIQMQTRLLHLLQSRLQRPRSGDVWSFFHIACAALAYKKFYDSEIQHLASLGHLDCVRESSRGSAGSTCSFADSSQAKGTLLERFLQDVLLHHPHCYNDPR